MQVGNVSSGRDVTLKEAGGDMVETTTTTLNLNSTEFTKTLNDAGLNEQQKEQAEQLFNQLSAAREARDTENFTQTLEELSGQLGKATFRWLAKIFCA